MTNPNAHYGELQNSYLVFNLAQKTPAYMQAHPDAHLLRLGIGDVTLPLCDAVIKALHAAVDDQSRPETFHGYMPECGSDFLREAVRGYYAARNIPFSADEIFVSSGASADLGCIWELVSADNTTLSMDPAYPAYVDANIIAGHRLIHYPSSSEDGFAPLPDDQVKADLIYICSPNNPTGAVFSREKLKAWIDYANRNDSVIIFDAAYEAFIEEDDIPHSIFEIEGSRTCAIEICSLSKTAGFTGTRCGYTIIPKELVRGGMQFNSMWVRNRTTKTNGVSYIIQRGADAVFSPDGQMQVLVIIAVY